MRSHHQAAIQKLKEAYEVDPEIIAVIVGGSVAKGWANDTSDLDFMVVVPEKTYQRARAQGQLTIYRQDITEYEGGYADGKIVPLSFLRLVSERGSEPARAAFLRAILLFDRSGSVADLLAKAITFPEGVEDRIRRFHSQLMIWSWYAGEAAKREDPYLMTKSTSQIALFAMRLVLAENRLLFPYHKWVTRMVEEAPDKPRDFVSQIRQMLATPSLDAVKSLVYSIHEWRGYEVDYREHCHHFLEDSEWNWIDHPAPIGDR